MPRAGVNIPQQRPPTTPKSRILLFLSLSCSFCHWDTRIYKTPQSRMSTRLMRDPVLSTALSSLKTFFPMYTRARCSKIHSRTSTQINKPPTKQTTEAYRSGGRPTNTSHIRTKHTSTRRDCIRADNTSARRTVNQYFTHPR